MEWLISHCSAIGFAHGGLYASLLFAGLIGSLTHCSIMCAPMVVSQMLNPSYKKTISPQKQLLAYHVGRITTYSTLGLIAGVAGSWLFGNSAFASFSGIALFIAGVIFLYNALWPNPFKACECDENNNILKLVQTTQWSPFLKSYLRGVLLGFMPCGLVLAALLMVATVQSAFSAALGMIAFGLGTTPLLHAFGVRASRLFSSQNRFGHYFGKGAMTLNGLVLCVLGIYQL